MLSQTVGYAVLALGYLAGIDSGPVLVKEISAATDIPSPYLAKIVNTLARKGFVVTQRGIGGGVALARPPEKVTLFELCVAFDDPLVQKRCMLGTAECSDERACPAHHFWSPHRERTVEFLKQTTLLDIAEFEARQRQKHGLQ